MLLFCPAALGYQLTKEQRQFICNVRLDLIGKTRANPEHKKWTEEELRLLSVKSGTLFAKRESLPQIETLIEIMANRVVPFGGLIHDMQDGVWEAEKKPNLTPFFRERLFTLSILLIEADETSFEYNRQKIEVGGSDAPEAARQMKTYLRSVSTADSAAELISQRLGDPTEVGSILVSDLPEMIQALQKDIRSHDIRDIKAVFTYALNLIGSTPAAHNKDMAISVLKDLKIIGSANE